ncbi:MAG: hydroxyethylthiazole kinase [Bacteroidales bacterium]
MDLNKVLSQLQEKSPLVHNITNYVTMNNTANALLSIGASPVMAHAVEEVEEMVKISSALVINIGTLSPHWVLSMIKAGITAKENNIPVIFDPVGVGATSYRNEVAKTILQECKPDIVRGNASEILSLVKSNVKTKGVDSTIAVDNVVSSAKDLANDLNTVVVVSGETDYITDGSKSAFIENGSPMMVKVTGMGCTATAIVAAFAGTLKNPFDAGVAGMAVMGVAGELAAKKSEGPGSLQLIFLDTLYNLNKMDLNSLLKIRNE